jgi:hypothetical protein
MSDNNLAKIFSDIPKLTGKENFVEWDQRLKLSLLIVKGSQFIEPNASPPERSQSAWFERDGQLAGLILQSTSMPILSAHLHLVIPSADISPSSSNNKETPPHTGKASSVYSALKKTYGTSNAQYTFALGRRFIENKAGEGSVSEWVNQLKAQHRELKSLQFNLDALGVNVLLNGLPERFSSYVDNVWTSSETPTIDSVCDSILRIDAGHQSRTDNNPLHSFNYSTPLRWSPKSQAWTTLSIRSMPSLLALARSLRKSTRVAAVEASFTGRTNALVTLGPRKKRTPTAANAPTSRRLRSPPGLCRRRCLPLHGQRQPD